MPVPTKITDRVLVFTAYLRGAPSRGSASGSLSIAADPVSSFQENLEKTARDSCERVSPRHGARCVVAAQYRSIADGYHAVQVFVNKRHGAKRSLVLGIVAQELAAVPPSEGLVLVGTTWVFKASASPWIGDRSLRQVTAARLAQEEKAVPDAELPGCLAVASLDEGDLYLWRISDRAARAARLGDIEGRTATSHPHVYVALANTSLQAGSRAAVSPTSMESSVLAGRPALLILPDLVAHVGYAQIREYTSEVAAQSMDRQFRERIGALRAETTRLLAPVRPVPFRDHRQSQHLTREYERLLAALRQFDSARYVLERLVHRSDRLARTWPNGITAFHNDRLHSALIDVTALVSEGQHELEAARAAVDLAGMESQRRLEMVLALVALALAMPELVDRELAAAIWQRLGVLSQPQHVDSVDLFVGQLAIIGGTVLAGVLVARALGRLGARWQRSSEHGVRSD